MEEGHDASHIELASWREQIIDRAKIRHHWLYPEMVESEYDNHGMESSNIPHEDIELVRQSQVVLAYVDSVERIGTICELSAAHAFGIPSYVAILNTSINDYENYRFVLPWFVLGLVDSIGEFETEKECIDWLIKIAGGEGVNYYEYIQSPEWREKAEAAKERAGQRCQVCYKSRDEITLDAHHRTYERLGDELPEDITVLCRNCHSLYEENRKLNGR